MCCFILRGKQAIGLFISGAVRFRQFSPPLFFCMVIPIKKQPEMGLGFRVAAPGHKSGKSILPIQKDASE